MLSYSSALLGFYQNSSDSSGDLTNWSVSHCFGVIYCNWCFYLVPRPSKAIACVCRKTCSPVGYIDSGCWLILLYWHVLMLSHCLTNKLLCKSRSTPCKRPQMSQSLFWCFILLQLWNGNKQVFFGSSWIVSPGSLILLMIRPWGTSSPAQWIMPLRLKYL